MKNISVLFVLISFYSYGQMPGDIEIRFSLDNKKIFFKGEVIIIDAIHTNTNDKPYAFESYQSLYSTTYQKDADSLGYLIPNYNKIKKSIIRCGAEEITGHNKKVKNDDLKRFKVESNYGTILPANGNHHQSYILNNCLSDIICPNLYYDDYQLPIGNYKFTVKTFLNDGRVFTKSYEFEIVEASELQREWISKIKDVYFNEYSKNPQTFIELYNACPDSALKDKIITLSIHDLVGIDELFPIWGNLYYKFYSKPLLIHFLLQIARSHNTDNTTTNFRMSVKELYLKFIRDVNDAEVSRTFLNAVNADITYRKHPAKLSEANFLELENEWKIKFSNN